MTEPFNFVQICMEAIQRASDLKDLEDYNLPLAIRRGNESEISDVKNQIVEVGKEVSRLKLLIEEF